MRNHLDLTDAEIERLLQGGAAEGADGLSGFVGVARYALLEAPSEEIARRQIAAISQAARTLDKAAPALDEAALTPRRFPALMDKALRIGLRVTAATIAGLSSMVGLAYAGVELPDPVASAVEAVLPMDLPNQDARPEKAQGPKTETDVQGTAGERSRSEDVHATQEAFGEDRGCEFGQAVAGTASENRQGDGGSDEPKCAEGSGSETGGSVDGEERSEQAKTEGKAKGEAASTEGQERKPDVPQGSEATGDESSAKPEDAGSASETPPAGEDRGPNDSASDRAPDVIPPEGGNAPGE